MAESTGGGIELLGVWETYLRRWADVTLRVTSRKRSTNRDEVAEYRLGPSPAPEPGGDVLDVFDLYKTLPGTEHHQVALHGDGRLTCTCKHFTYLDPAANPPVCVHVATVLTMAKRFEKVVLPLPRA